jgi:hypothetical protein
MLLEDLSYAIEDLEAARPLFKVIDALEGLPSFLSPNQEEMLMESQVVRRSLIEHGPFINFVLENNDRLHLIASNVNETGFKVKEDLKMYSVNLAIMLEEKADLVKEISDMEGKITSLTCVLHTLKDKKRKLDVDICTDMYRLVNRNRLLSVMMKYQSDLLNQLDEFGVALFAADEKMASMETIAERARAAARRC